MDDQAVSCTIKPAVYLNIGAAEAAARSGVCVLDVSLPFGKTVNVSCSSESAKLDPRFLRSVGAVHAGYCSPLPSGVLHAPPERPLEL